LSLWAVASLLRPCLGCGKKTLNRVHGGHCGPGPHAHKMTPLKARNLHTMSLPLNRVFINEHPGGSASEAQQAYWLDQPGFATPPRPLPIKPVLTQGDCALKCPSRNIPHTGGGICTSPTSPSQQTYVIGRFTLTIMFAACDAKK